MPKSRSQSVSSDPVSRARSALDRAERELARLERAREKLLAEKTRVEQAIRSEHLNQRAHVRRIWTDGAGLGQLLEVLLSEVPMSVSEATEAALAVGYRTGSKNFRRMVACELYCGGRFERVAPGVFRTRYPLGVAPATGALPRTLGCVG